MAIDLAQLCSKDEEGNRPGCIQYILPVVTVMARDLRSPGLVNSMACSSAEYQAEWTTDCKSKRAAKYLTPDRRCSSPSRSSGEIT